MQSTRIAPPDLKKAEEELVKRYLAAIHSHNLHRAHISFKALQRVRHWY